MSFTLPEDFINRMKTMLGDEFDAFLCSYENTNYQALRINRLKGTVDSFLSVSGCDELLSPVTWTSDGFYYPETKRPGKHPYHEAGVYYIQEPSAMLPAALLDARPGEKVLDLCAAPGGKSTQIASSMQQQGLLVSNEIHPARAKILSENMERMGVRNAIVTNESPQSLTHHFPSYFDRIMVDAPCSGEGMFRKNEEAVSQWSLENVQHCAERQDEILNCAADMLKPGGTLVYSTCTFSPDENEGTISRFIQKHPDYNIVTQQRLWPHEIKGEGHFAAVLKKEGSATTAGGSVLPSASKMNLKNNRIQICENKKSAKKENVKNKQKSSHSQTLNSFEELQTFLSSALCLELSGKIEMFGDQIYLLPDETPSLAGLRVLRAGLHLGTQLKNRFEPSHALALTLHPEEAHFRVMLTSGMQVGNTDGYHLVCDYINGQTFAYDGEKGWYLICIDGYSIGWGKLAGGIMKNHYPKGLRKQL